MWVSCSKIPWGKKRLKPEENLTQDLDDLLQWNERKIVLTAEQKASLRTIQKRATERYRETKVEEWRAKAVKKTEKQIVDSISQPESGRPMNVVTYYRPNQIADRPFLLWVRRRLCLSVVAECKSSCVKCSGHLDQAMEHAFKCNKMGHGRLHNHIKYAAFKAIRQVANYVGDQVVMEPSIQEYARDTPENQKDAEKNPKGRRGDIGVVDVGKRQTFIIDVRTCAVISGVGDSTLVANGEKEKHETYARRFEFPDGMSLVPMAIDTYGRFGEEFKQWLSNYCKQAAAGNNQLYNNMIGRVRSTIEVALAIGVGDIVKEATEVCICPNDRMLLMGYRPKTNGTRR